MLQLFQLIEIRAVNEHTDVLMRRGPCLGMVKRCGNQ